MPGSDGIRIIILRELYTPWMQELKKKLQDEVTALEYELRNELPKEILKARAHGDLRENAEYKAAMERQSMVQARIMHVRNRLFELEAIDLTKIPTDSAAYGSTLILFDVEREEKVKYKLVTSEESDPENGLISTVSPIGQALMGKEEGDEIKVKTPTGWRNFEVTRLTTIHEREDS